VNTFQVGKPCNIVEIVSIDREKLNEIQTDVTG